MIIERIADDCFGMQKLAAVLFAGIRANGFVLIVSSYGVPMLCSDQQRKGYVYWSDSQGGHMDNDRFMERSPPAKREISLYPHTNIMEDETCQRT